MSVRTGTVTPALNTQFTIPQPIGQTDAKRLVLYNQSPFVLTVSIGSIKSFLPAFTADIYTLDPNPEDINVVPVISSSTSPLLSSIYGVFYYPDEDLPYASFPISLAGGPSPTDIAVSVAQQAFSQLATTLLNTGSRIIDQPFVATRANLTSNSEQSAFFNVPASGFQSYILMLQFSNGAQSATNYATVEIRFKDDTGQVVWRDLIEVNAGNVETYLTDRMHGSIMTLFPTFPGGTLFCDWLFSNRPADRLHFMEQACNDRILLDRKVTNVAANSTSAHQFVPAFHGPASMQIDGSAPTSSANFNFFFGSLAPIAVKFKYAGSPIFIDNIVLPLRPLHYTIDNLEAAARDFILSVWARDN